eukprot:tig00000157_g9647.t1
MVTKTRKVCVLGARAVGKSAVTIQYVEDHFVDNYSPTIETTFQKVIKYRGDEYVTDIIDTAGQDEYSIFPTGYSVGVHGYVLLFSVTSKSSFDMIRIINNKLLNLLGTEKVPRVLVGNKTDQSDNVPEVVTSEMGRQLAAELGCTYIECSAKNNLNVADVFKQLLIEIEKSQAPAVKPKEGCIVF